MIMESYNYFARVLCFGGKSNKVIFIFKIYAMLSVP